MPNMSYNVQDEGERLNAVKRFEQFDFDLNKNLQGILKLAADIYETPVAFITLIDENIQWFKVNRGFEVKQMPRETSFCTHVILSDEVMIVNDAFEDVRFADNPLVRNTPNIRFYAGAPLSTREGINIGTLCVMDTSPKVIAENKREQLQILAQQAIHIMELELTYKLLNDKMQQVELQNNALKDIAFIQSHEFRGPLSTIIGLMNVIKDEGYESPKEYLLMMEDAVSKLDEKIHMVVRSTEMVKSIVIS
jgi:GAF domain-containing protein